MRYRRSHILNGSTIISCLLALIPLTLGIMVPTGKLTPITPAEPPPPIKIVPSSERKTPAAVYEYTEENPEPPPLDPSYVPVQYEYIQYLRPTAIVYVPMQIKNPNVQKFELDKYKSKYDKRGKIPIKVLEKYQNYPAHLQKKYLHYYLTNPDKS